MNQLERIKKKIYGYTTATTVISTIFTVLLAICFILGIIIMGASGDFASDSINRLENVNSDDFVAGYSVLGHLSGGLLGTMGWAFGGVIVICCSVLGIFFLIMTIHGFYTLKCFNNQTADNIQRIGKTVKTDSILKLVINGILLLISLGAEINLFYFICITPLLAVCILCIATLVMIKS